MEMLGKAKWLFLRDGLSVSEISGPSGAGWRAPFQTGVTVKSPFSVRTLPVTVDVNEFIKETAMRASDVVPISEARARLTELAEDVVGAGSEKILTKNGASYVALVDAKKLDYYHALEEEHASLVLLDEAEAGLRQILDGQVGSEADLGRLLAD